MAKSSAMSHACSTSGRVIGTIALIWSPLLDARMPIFFNNGVMSLGVMSRTPESDLRYSTSQMNSSSSKTGYFLTSLPSCTFTEWTVKLFYTPRHAIIMLSTILALFSSNAVISTNMSLVPISILVASEFIIGGIDRTLPSESM